MDSSDSVRIAYFSMEVAVGPAFPTYAGGLGVLAGDTLRSAADLSVPIAAVTLLHRKGYFRQTLDAEGRQSEAAEEWEPERVLERMEPVVSVELAGQSVKVRAWRYWITGATDHRAPVYFLDTNLRTIRLGNVHLLISCMGVIKRIVSARKQSSESLASVCCERWATRRSSAST